MDPCRRRPGKSAGGGPGLIPSGVYGRRRSSRCSRAVPAPAEAGDLLAAKRDLALPRQLRKLDNYDFLLLDDLGYLPQGAEESEGALHAHRRTLRKALPRHHL